MEDVLVAVVVCGFIFIGLPWLIFHYVTRWKTQATLTTDDENMLDDLHELARKLEERLATVERIMAADNPNWRALAGDPTRVGREDDPSNQRMKQ